METPSKKQALEAVRTLIQYLGDDPDREGLKETPERVLRSYSEIYQGYQLDPAEILDKKFSTHSGEMVVLSNIELYSTCEHHMMPFLGKCHIAYVPKDRVVGLSKLARLMEVYSRRLQIQEEMTWQIAQALSRETGALGVAVLVEARHMCMSARGVSKQNGIMSTIASVGTLRSNPALKAHFMAVIDKSKL